MVELAATIFSDGPSSNPNQPMKPLIRDWGTWIEGVIAAFFGSGGKIYQTKAALTADLIPAANSSAWVMEDPVAANNGVYRKVGGTGTGSWVRAGDLPFSFIIASDVGAGTANAIQATTSIPVSGSSLVWMNVFETNTGSPVTVSFNGSSVLTIKTNTGNNVDPNGLPAGMIVMGIVSGSTFRLLSDQVSSAVVAAAEAAKVAAQVAQAAAEAAAASINQRIYTSVSLAAAGTIPAIVKRLQTQFYAPNFVVPATLVGGAHYRRISLADLAGFQSASYFRSVDRYMPDGTTDNTNGGYWVIDEPKYQPEMFGAVQDFNGTSGTDNTTSMSAMIAAANHLKVPIHLKMGKGYYCASGLAVTNMSLTVDGDGLGSSSIIFNNAGDGLVIAQDDYRHATSLEKFSIFTIRQEPGVGLKISYSASDSIGNRNVPRCRVVDVECRGYDVMSQGWNKGMVLTDVHRPDIVRPHVTGRRNLLAGGVTQFLNMASGIEIVGSYPPTFSAIPSEIIIDTPHIDQCVCAIKSIGEVEGLMIDTPTIVAVDGGVSADYATTRPHVKVAGGHINCFTYGVHLHNAPQSSISDLLIYKFQDSVNDTVGVIVDSSDDTSVKNLTLINQASNATTNGEWNGVIVNNSVRCTIDDIRHTAPSKTVIVSGTSTLTRTSNIKPDGAYLNATVQTYDDTSSGTNEYSGGNKPIANKQNVADTVVTGSPTVLAFHGPIKVNKGERYLVQGFVNAVKGGTVGEFLTTINAPVSGGAAASFGAGRSSLLERGPHAAGVSLAQTVSGVLTVTTTGSLTFQLLGTSTGSNSNVLAGDAQMSVTLL